MFLCPACTGPPRTNDNPRMLSLASFVLAAAVLQTPSPAAPPPDATAHARAVLSAIAAGEFGKVEADFTSEMRAALPSGRLAAMWAALQGRAGAYKSCGTDPRVVKIGDKEMVITACAFERATVDVQFAFDSSGRISGLVFRPGASAVSYSPPPYATASAYAEMEKTIGSGEWTLPSTISLPAGARSAAAVVLVHGSGPGDRDSTIGSNKPFKDLAAGLASRGIAVAALRQAHARAPGEDGRRGGLHRATGGDRRRPRSGEGPPHRASDRPGAHLRARPQPRWHARAAHLARRSGHRGRDRAGGPGSPARRGHRGAVALPRRRGWHDVRRGAARHRRCRGACRLRARPEAGGREDRTNDRGRARVGTGSISAATIERRRQRR